MQDIPRLVTEPGGWFLLSATATMVGGVFFLVWLSEQITRHGIGNGLALILFVGIIVSLPADIAANFELLRQGAISANLLLLLAVLVVVGVAVIVLVEGARRNVPVQYAARQAGTRLLPPRSSVLSIKLNSAGFLIPATVTPWVFYLPLALATFALRPDAVARRRLRPHPVRPAGPHDPRIHRDLRAGLHLYRLCA